MRSLVHISIVICTLDRREQLIDCLESCSRLSNSSPSHEVIVVDNSVEGDARSIVESFQDWFPVKIIYCHEPGPNISRARNRGVANSHGRYIAFLDDDNAASPGWLEAAFETLEGSNADILLGEIRPRLDKAENSNLPDAGDWFARNFPLKEGQLLSFKRSGHLVGGGTANSFFRTETTMRLPEPFDPAFGRTGGEDTDLFQRIRQEGATGVYSRNAWIEETIPSERQTIQYVCHRKYRGSQIFLRCVKKNHPAGIGAVAFHMAVGLLQAGTAATSLILIPKANSRARMHRRVKLYSALGKCLWFTQSEPPAYS